eukprot:GILK01003494.1.p1 GENE.GILK01003494.1~~GILK01003494.1.p1  ORF type:complete len:351 (-),score=36.94 GILK01003494.1:290-1312(-)
MEVETCEGSASPVLYLWKDVIEQSIQANEHRASVTNGSIPTEHDDNTGTYQGSRVSVEDTKRAVEDTSQPTDLPCIVASCGEPQQTSRGYCALHLRRGSTNANVTTDPTSEELSAEDTFDETILPSQRRIFRRRWASVCEEGEVEFNGEDVTDADTTEPRVRSVSGVNMVPATRRFSFVNSWTLWYDQQTSAGCKSVSDYCDSLQELGSFKTVQEFWMFWNNLCLNRMPNFSNISVFKNGIRPLWEDPHNRNGGRWIVKFPKADRAASEEKLCLLVLNLIGLQFSNPNHLGGVMYSIRPRGVTLNLWASWFDDDFVYRVENEIRERLELSDQVETEFKSF